MPYLNVDEVESATVLAAGQANAGFTELMALPNPTWDGRQCRAIRIHQGPTTAAGGVYFLGGVHAREWGSPDILINFVRLLTNAYRTNGGITQGGMTFTAAHCDDLGHRGFPAGKPGRPPSFDDGRRHVAQEPAAGGAGSDLPDRRRQWSGG
jgi:hypothetical protein